MDEPRIKASEKILDQMLLALAAGGFVTLEPQPPPPPAPDQADKPALPSEPYSPVLAHATAELDKLLVFRSIHPFYGAFLINQLGIADRDERLQAFESVLEVPRPLLRYLRVPPLEELPPGSLARTRLDEELVRRGLIAAPMAEAEDDEENEEDGERPPTLADKLRLLFDARFPEVGDVKTQSVWCAGELLRFNGNFNLFVKSRDLVKQEGIVFRHLLRLILLCGEFALVNPSEGDPAAWQAELRDLAERLTASCREVDPTSTDEAIQQAHAADVVEGEAPPTN
jgi:hypothetical protein